MCAAKTTLDKQVLVCKEILCVLPFILDWFFIFFFSSLACFFFDIVDKQVLLPSSS